MGGESRECVCRPAVWTGRELRSPAPLEVPLMPMGRGIAERRKTKQAEGRTNNYLRRGGEQQGNKNRGRGGEGNEAIDPTIDSPRVTLTLTPSPFSLSLSRLVSSGRTIGSTIGTIGTIATCRRPLSLSPNNNLSRECRIGEAHAFLPSSSQPSSHHSTLP